jgi:virulence factor Mce-like protein
VGAIAAVVLAVVGYVSYTALNGLPFQPTYDVQVELPDASRLVVNDTVRVRGVRVGRVADVQARPATAAGPASALISLALDGSMPPLPVDSTVRTRAASVLGASYVELSPGSSQRTVPQDGTLPLRNASSTVEVTDLFSIFDRGTRRDVGDAAEALGGGFAGRSPDLNALIASIASLMAPLTTVSKTLADPGTELPGFITGVDRFTAALAGVSPELVGAVRGGATTFGALAAERQALDRTIALLPVAESSATSALARAKPALRNLADIAEELQPAGRRLAPGLEATNEALAAGVPVLRRTPSFARGLGGTFAALEQTARRPTTRQTLGKLTDAVGALDPTVRTLEAAQVNCNVIPLLLQGAFDLAAFPLIGRDGSASPPIFGAGVQVSHVGAEGEVLQQPRPSRNSAINYLPNQNAQECESGNELHDATSQILDNPPGLQAKRVPETEPLGDATRYAREAGLLARPEGWRP